MALGFLLAMLLSAAPPAEAKKKSKGVDNPEGDYEIFITNPKGKKPKQITRNAVDDYSPTLSPDGQKIAYASNGLQTSNPEGDYEVYLVNTLDGSGQKNLSNNGADVEDFSPDWNGQVKKK